MPKPKEGETQKEFVGRCIPIVMKEGTAKDNKQAVAICYSMWREHEKDKRKSLSMSVTLKTDPTSGRVRWKAIANSGEFDQQGDRFDESFFDDIVANFWRVQDAMSRGDTIPPGYAHEEMPVPQLDVAHYSFQLARADRIKARAGAATFAYRDNKKLILQGHFDTTPLGQGASKSVLSDDKDVIKTSIGVWPDWENVETLSDGRRIFKGGKSIAYLDHLALTAHPVDARTEIEAEGNMEKSLTVADDALEVLGDETLVKELEQARGASKSEAVPDGALAKADDNPEGMAQSVVTVTHETKTTEVTTVEKDRVADAIDAKSAELAAQVASQEKPGPEEQSGPMYESLAKSLNETQSVVAAAIEAMTKRLEVLEKSLSGLGNINELATALAALIETAKASEAQKVKSALDNHGWLDIAKLYSARSDPNNVVTVDGGKRAAGPQETQRETQQAAGPIAGQFVKT